MELVRKHERNTEKLDSALLKRALDQLHLYLVPKFKKIRLQMLQLEKPQENFVSLNNNDTVPFPEFQKG